MATYLCKCDTHAENSKGTQTWLSLIHRYKSYNGDRFYSRGNVVDSSYRVTQRSQLPFSPVPANGAQKKKLSKGQKKLALQTLREEGPARRADRLDAELAASMSTNLENIEHAVHPERLALIATYHDCETGRCYEHQRHSCRQVLM
ncbi:hypothetical protein MRB53_040932 [Persea americana]|nr:hypothetical protein MRB53_040932 [Persea americana]